MSTKYLSNAVIVLLGGSLAVLSMGLPLATAVAWVAFGIAIGVLAVSVVVQLDTRRGGVQRVFDLLVTATGGTLLGVSVAFGGSTVVWLALALALGLVGVGFVGLTMHEIATWRARHSLGKLHWLPLGKETGQRAA